jgi:hypothetical protein
LIAGFVPGFGVHPNVFSSLSQQSSKHFKTIIKMTPVILSYLFVGFAEGAMGGFSIYGIYEPGSATHLT